MDRLRKRFLAEESLSRLERAPSGVAAYRKDRTSRGSTDAEESISSGNTDFKGPLGLNLLHTVPEPLVDLIFIHGLGGGSRKTWSKTPDPYHYWPKAWISRDPEFSSVRVHSFGYKADWAERKPSFLRIHDFSLALLGEIQCNPDIRRSNTKIVFVAHSMGGIVTKKAYILARQDPTLTDIARRIHTLFFLATPHRGADLVKTWHNVLRVSFGQKKFLEELERDSESVQSINDSFRCFADDLHLWSFYETLPCSLPFTDAIIVDKVSAILGLPNERCFLLNADHRGVCKFDSPTDANYKTLRNALCTTVDSILAKVSQGVSDTVKTDYSNLISLTGVSEAPIDDLSALEKLRVPGTCEWLNLNAGYSKWKSALSPHQSIFWLTGDAGCGKSVLSGHVVKELEESNVRCSYFFFKQGNLSKSSISGCLLSLAFQIGQSDEKALQRMSKLYGKSDTWEHLDERTLWRKVFLGCIFEDSNHKPHYWVIDALDECHRYPILVSFLSEAPPYLKIFLTSRNTPEVHQNLTSHASAVQHHSVQEQDTLVDLRVFIDSRIKFLPAHGIQEDLGATILERANGSFLWASIVLRELEGVYSKEAAEEVLNAVPADMNDLYTQMLEDIPPKALRIARSILIWTLLVVRPLSLDEMKLAIGSDTGETFHNLADAIMAICGQLIGISQNGQVQCIHQTAKMFLLDQLTVPKLIINEPEDHSRIAGVCLQSLNESFGKRTRRKLRTSGALEASYAGITDYAALYFSHHLQKCASEDSGIGNLLLEFLENNVFAWIEYLAQTERLQYLSRTAKQLKSYLISRLQHEPLYHGKGDLEAWIEDLMKLSAKFRAALAVCPSAIQNVLPAICPIESQISKKYTSRPRGIIVKGFTDRSWDECLARTEYPNVRTTAVAHGLRYLAVAVSNGTIYLHSRDSVVPIATLSHGERVSILQFSSDDLYLVSSGPRMVRIWDPQTQTLTRSFDVKSPPVAIAFIDGNESLIAATRGNYTVSWDLHDDQGEDEIWSWASCFQESTGQEKPVQPPGKAHISAECSVLAVSYRGKPIYLFDMMTETFLGSCSRASRIAMRSEYAVDALAFNPSREFRVLVVSYGDGGLALFDQWTAEPQYQIQDVFAHTLAWSPDGRFLITGSARGTIQMFQLVGARGTELTLIYRINTHEDGIRGVTFSSDSLRFADIRSSQCRIWEPSVLINNFEEINQSEPTQAVTLKPKTLDMQEWVPEAEITAICSLPCGSYLFYGKEDGTVMYFDVRNTVQGKVLYQHALNIRITSIAYCDKSGLLATADEASRVFITKLQCTATGCELLSTVADVRCGHPVQGLLFNTPGTRLLVQGRDSARVWTTHGVKTNTEIELKKFGNDFSFFNHPFEPDVFLLIASNHTSVHPWVADSEVISPDDNGAQDIGANEKDKSMRDPRVWNNMPFVVPRRTEKLLAALTKTYTRPRTNSHSELRVWEASKISPSGEWPEVITLPGFEHISTNIRQIICVIGYLILFLDNDLWVCSIDVARWIDEKKGAQRHFFLLSEWKGYTDDFLIEYIPTRREFLVVKKHDVLVIRRGLDVASPLL